MRIIPLFIALLFTARLSAQNCGCADAGNCPDPFPPNSNSTTCYEITDAFNSNLASPTQGVCGVRVRFRHGRVGSLNLTLTSPDGTAVQLVGATGTCNLQLTPLATWDILFVPCSEPCDPDTLNGCAYPCVFDACPDNCNWQNAVFTGSYHPFSGCLEDFDSGSANGMWCLEVDNNAQFNGGSILDFEVILCDQSGYFCCDADAGNLAFEPNVNACEGDSALLLTPDPIYGALVPDPAQYGYNYLVFQGGSLLSYDSLTNFISYPVGTYNVCGLSYLIADTASLPDPGTPLTPAALLSDLTGATPSFCGDIDTNCIRVQISAPPPVQNLAETICEGDTIFVGNQGYTLPGNYADTLLSFGNCDSIVNLTLTVLEPDTTIFGSTICNGDSVVVGDTAFYATGLHEVLLQNVNGCDSTILLDLTVLPPIETALADTICNGDTIWVDGNAYTTTGTFQEILTSDFGCDSTVILTLTVVYVGVDIAAPDTLTCAEPSTNLNANASTTLGGLAFVWSTIGGHFVGSTSNLTVTVDDPGMYLLNVLSSGCSAVDSVTVIEDGDFPDAVATASPGDTLTCATTVIQLDGTGTTGGANLDFQWLAQNGSPISDPTSLTPTVTEPDIYQLIVTDLDNGCVDTAAVEIFQNIAQPIANAGTDTLLSCAAPQVTLDGSASQTATTNSTGLSFAWSASPGNILPPANVANPIVDEPGTYQLIIADLTNGCQDTDLVVITVDTLTPQAIISIPGSDSLTCTNSTVTLDGSASTGSQFVVFQWIGNIATGQGTPIATTTQPGNFSLIVTDTSNGCADTADVSIIQDLDLPQADAGANDTLSCTNISALVGGAGTSAGSEFAYAWTVSPSGVGGGHLLPPTDQSQATADSAGTYILTVTNIFNQCSAQDSVVVFANTDQQPVADAGSDGVLNCQDTTFTLDASGSTIVPFTILEWQTTGGTSLGSNLQVTVNQPDTFILTVSFAFCTSTDTAIVTRTTVPPTADADGDALLDCNSGQVTLDGTDSSVGTDLIYQWMTIADGQGNLGQIVSGSTTLAPVAGKVGGYVLNVTDTLTHCAASDTTFVLLDTIACLPSVNAGADGLVNCYSLLFQDTLSASGSAGGNFSYDWQVLNGEIVDVSDPFAPILRPGEYVFSVTNDAVGLTAFDTVLVVADTLPPVADAGATILPLNCPQLTLCQQLDASGSAQGSNFTYLWETANGTFCSPTNVLNAEILGEGIYNLQVTDLDNGCSGFDGVVVQLLDFLPLADAGADVQMLCGDTTATLDGGSSSLGNNYNFTWTSSPPAPQGGTIVSGGDTPNPVVAPGIGEDSTLFFLTVFNTLNLCEDADTVAVFPPAGCYPACTASVSGELTCDVDTVNLSSAGSSAGADISYQWTVLGGTGNLCGGETTAQACADAAGFYQLTVIRTYPNGATFSTDCSVQVGDNSQPPAVDAGQNDNLNCADTVLQLHGSATAPGNILTYNWSTPPAPQGGNIVSGGTTATPTVNLPGIYNLFVTNEINGCTATDFVTVGLDTLHPTADAGTGDQLTCSSSTAILNGSSNPPGMNFLWKESPTTGGEICAGETSPNPIICAAGTYILTVTNPANGCTATDSTTVTQDGSLPTPDAGENLHYTCADTIFVIQATATGGALLNYLWEALDGGCIVGATDILQPTVACPGTYLLTVTDQVNGCSAFSQMLVIADTFPPMADAGASQEINCQMLVVQLDGSGSTPTGQINYLWTTSGGGHISGETTATPQVDSAGIYQLLVTNQFNQCTDTASVLVSIDADIPVADAGNDSTLTCIRLSLKLDGTGSSVSPSIIYNWTTNDGNISSGANTLTPTITKTGTYVLEVTDTSSLCEVTDTTEVTLDTVSPTAQIDQSQTLTITCTVQDISLDGNLSAPAGNLNFAWGTLNGSIVTGVNGAVAHVDSGGWYTLTVTSLTNGCTDSTGIFVGEDFEKPAVQFTPAPVLDCDHLTVQLQVFPPSAAPIYNYVWSGAPPILDGDTPTPTVSKPGVFSVTITNTENGCENEGSLVVQENQQLPTAVAATIGSLDCDNFTATVTGEGSSVGNVSYEWTTSSAGNIEQPTAFSTEVDAAGWYFLTVRRLDNGCTASDSTQVTASSQPITGAIFSLIQPSCEDPEGYILIDSVFGGSPEFSYSLNGGIFIDYPQFSFLDPGEHEVQIQDENGCEWDTTIMLFEPGEIQVELGDDIFISQGESASFEALLNVPGSQLDTMIWQNLSDSAACPTCLEQTVFPTKTTTYRITVIDTGGCMASDRITVWVNEESPFFVPTAFSPNGDGINDVLLLFAGKDIPIVHSFMIFDRWGNLVFSAEEFPPNDPATGWDGNFNGEVLNAQVLVWKAEVGFLDGGREVFFGDVTLMR